MGGSVTDIVRPRLNPNLAAGTVGVVHLAVGVDHAAALTRDNRVLTWGSNIDGALGRDTTGDPYDDDDDDDDDGNGNGIGNGNRTANAMANANGGGNGNGNGNGNGDGNGDGGGSGGYRNWPDESDDDDPNDADYQPDGDTDDRPLCNLMEATPTQVGPAAFPQGTIFTQLAATKSATFVLTSTGSVYGWDTFRVGLHA
jgi:regulator of chromosome condensation